MTVLSTNPSVPVPARPSRSQRRTQIGDRLLDALESIVARHRSFASSEPAELHAELIAAEVAHQLALTRSELRRVPPLRTEE